MAFFELGWARIALILVCSGLLVPYLIRLAFRSYGDHVKRNTFQRKQFIIERARSEQKEFEQAKPVDLLDEDWERVDKSRRQSDADAKPEARVDTSWDGVVGFFHPFCNAGGGGERVLWAAVRATQQKWPNAICVVYTGDHEVGKEDILSRVQERFNIHLHPPTVLFLYLSTRQFVLASTWPHFTLAGQSLGSLIVAHDAFTNLLVPDILVDTMGYALAVGYCKLLFPDVPTAAYVHYPTISTDMLDSLDAPPSSGQGLNAGAGAGWKGWAKKRYWRLFAALYGRAGGTVDVVMTNSSWTQAHIDALWGPSRRSAGKPVAEVVFPPVAVRELADSIPLDAAGEAAREPELLCIAQFRPEKNHSLVLRAFAKLLAAHDAAAARTPPPRLTLAGSVRDSADETHIYALRLLAHELRVTDSVTFLLNAAWPAVRARLAAASLGVNAMWNEHFGIGVVEYQAAGLLCVVNDSGGPKMDIVVDDADGAPTGWRASSEDGYAAAFAEALGLPDADKVAMRRRARARARTFDEAVFADKWAEQLGRAVALARRQAR